jgi:Do/DeqQ family serine protease
MSARLYLMTLAGAVVGLAAGAYLWSSEHSPFAVRPVMFAQAQIEAPEPTRAVPERSEQLRLSFAPIVKSVTPSVVNVYATTVTQSASPFAGDPFFQRFFGGDPFFSGRPRQSQSLGSGVIVEESGVVLTNSHVVSGATDIRIATADGREFAVDLALDDPKTDLAVLRVRDANGASFPAIRFADSDALEVGDLVLAIGNPFGVGQTVTSGIVSALARTGVENSNYEFFIQTDAAINPGNSGGALVDLDGRLVGINTAIFSRTGGSIGIGFAIPSNMARVVAQAGIAGGELVRPWFGARTQEVTSDIANSLGLAVPRGALITDVAPGGTAERAGFQPGDVVLAVDGLAIEQPSAFDFRLATREIGSEVTVAFFRDGREQEVRITLEPAPRSGELVTVGGDTRFAGTAVETLNPAAAQELGLPYSARGVIVRRVEPGSPAAQLGLRPGDLILSLNGREIEDADTFRSIADARPNAWEIVLRRGGRIYRSVVSG